MTKPYRASLILLAAPMFAFAAEPLKPKTVEEVTQRLTTIAGLIFDFTMVVGIVCALYAAYLYMTAGGSSEKVTQANQALMYAIIGIAVALLAKGVPDLVGSVIGT